MAAVFVSRIPAGSAPANYHNDPYSSSRQHDGLDYNARLVGRIPLTSAENLLVEEAFQSCAGQPSEETAVLAQAHKIDLTRKDILTLSGGNMLNDQVSEQSER
jgi:hypothetical protein